MPIPQEFLYHIFFHITQDFVHNAVELTVCTYIKGTYILRNYKVRDYTAKLFLYVVGTISVTDKSTGIHIITPLTKYFKGISLKSQ